MGKSCFLALGAVAFVGVRADDLSDFSNDLATDIGPLLVLFGESMTKQYLSESTTFLDYFIFAMAPIGILTAIVSVIRVCGHSSLRAFIGRSQEGEGEVEAELCTSTGRDVCELFNRGGITRVLGRPSILELVYIPHPVETGKRKVQAHKDNVGLFLSRNYFERHSKEPETSDGPAWEEITGSILERPSTQDTSFRSFAPNPNISLNAGIIKRPKWVFISIATVGLVLQAGVLALAGVGVWTLQWNLNEGRNSSMRDYAPVMFIIGTILMCGGMWACAFLIGQTTHEIRFRRNRQHHFSEQPRLLWLQPGPQTIGDQSFDPFAYFEDPEKDPLQIWMSSQKKSKDKFELYTVLAVLASFIGYIMQFIGLRGMKAWVSLAQLGITVVMSILRGCLRMQRLDKSDNKLADKPDLVAGYELDWLSFQIGQNFSNEKSLYWHVTGQHGEAVEIQSENQDSSTASESHALPHQESKGAYSLGAATALNTRSAKLPQADSSCVDVNALLQIRVRLAQLTGHFSFVNLEDTEYQQWKDEFVRVRSKAHALSTAVCSAASKVFSKSRQKEIILGINTASFIEGSTTGHEQQISFILKPPSKSSQANWRMESTQVEAVLGLWMWSLVSNKRLHKGGDGSSQAISTAERIPRARIICAGLDDERVWGEKSSNMQGEMDLWLGPDAVSFVDGTLTFHQQGEFGLATLFQSPSGASNCWQTLPKKKTIQDAQLTHAGLWRFCGWNSVYNEVKLERSGAPATETRSQELDQKITLRAQLRVLASRDPSLLDICAQELFTALVMSLSSLLTIETTTIAESAGAVRLQNETLRAFATAFEVSVLGSHSEALLCIIPALRQKLTLPEPENMLSAVIKAAGGYRRKAEWERAETLLRWACVQFFSPSGDLEHVFIKALRAVGELYRYSFSQENKDASEEFGMSGIQWMTKTYGSLDQSTLEIREILECYQEVAQRIEQSAKQKVATPGSSKIRENEAIKDKLMEAIRGRNRVDALYHLCFISAGSLGSENLQPALPLAVRNDWSEVVSALLEMKANPNSRDEAGRTAVSYCAELGYQGYLRDLIDRGASLDLSEKDQQTPLFWAAQNGNQDVVKLLLDSRDVDVNRRNTEGQTPLWVAAEFGHENVLKQLHAKGADIESKDNSRRSLLSVAAGRGDKALVRLLLKEGANIESKDNSDRTPLFAAVGEEDANMIRLLLEEGADIESKDSKGLTPLHYSIIQGIISVAELLIKMGANTESMDSGGETPLLSAIRGRNEIVVRLLLENGADIESRVSGQRPLIQAIVSGIANIFQLLLDKNASVKLPDETGRTPLSHAAEWRAAEQVRQLLKRGSHIDSKDEYGRTPLSYAVARPNNHEVVEILLEERADPHCTDNEGKSPFERCADEDYTGNFAMNPFLPPPAARRY